jgi:transposase
VGWPSGWPMHRETLRNWVRQAEVDEGRRPGTTTVEAERIKQLESEVKELKRANDILRAASAFSPGRSWTAN